MKRNAWVAIVLVLLACTIQNVCVAETEPMIQEGVNDKYRVILVDEIDLLTEDEEKRVQEAMMPISKGGDVLFCAIRQNGDTNILASRMFDKYISKQTDANGILFLIDMHQRNIYIYSRGNMERIITRSDAYNITADNSRYATTGKYADCAVNVFSTIAGIMEGETNSALSTVRIFCDVLTAAIVGLLIAYCFISSVQIQHVKNKGTLTNVRNICVKVHLTDAEFTCLGREYIDRSSSGSGGGGSSGSSGGSGGSSGGSGGGSSF